MNRFKDVCTIIVTDYTGKSKKCQILNDPVEIRLLDVQDIDNTPRVIVHSSPSPSPQPTPPPPPAERSTLDIFQSLKGLFTGTKFEGLGDFAPVAGYLAAGNDIERLQEKNTGQAHRIAELEKKNAELEQKYETLADNYEQLQDDADDMEDELDLYHQRDLKNDQLTSLAGAVLASGAKNFLRQNPAILSGIIPAEQLAGMLSDDEPALPAEPVNTLSDDDRERMDNATVVFDWLQTLSPQEFEKVIYIISVLRQNIVYADQIIGFLNGKNRKT